MKKLFVAVGAMGLMFAGLSAEQAQADPFIVTITQQGSNVVATSSGSIDLAGLTAVGSGPVNGPLIASGDTELVIGPLAVVGTAYAGAIVGPLQFGTDTVAALGAGTGDGVGILLGETPNWNSGANSLFIVDSLPGSVNSPSSSGTWANSTLASLGLTLGTSYEWTWGTGADQSFTIDVGTTTSTAPEPSSLALLGVGLLALVFLRSRKGRMTNSAGVPLT